MSVGAGRGESTQTGGVRADAKQVDSRPIWRRALASRGLQVFVLALAVAWMGWTWLDASGGPEALRERYGWRAALVLVPLQALVSLSPFPGEMVALANGYLFGFWWGSFLIWLAWMMTAYAQYALVRRAAKDLDLDMGLDRLPGWIRRFPVDHPVFLIFARWLPYGAHLVNSAAGAFRVPLWRFTWCAAIGIGVGAVVMAAIGNGVALL